MSFDVTNNRPTEFEADPDTNFDFTSHRIDSPDQIIGHPNDAKTGMTTDHPFYWEDQGRQYFYFMGREHREIYPFINYIFGPPKDRPLVIVNFDEHVDDGAYGSVNANNGRGLTASWQRYLNDQHYTSFAHQFNIYPFSNAVQSSQIVQEFSWDDHKLLSLIPNKVDVVSIDLDFFNPFKVNDREWSNAVDIITKLIKRSTATMTFTSPAFVQHFEGISLGRTFMHSAQSS